MLQIVIVVLLSILLVLSIVVLVLLWKKKKENSEEVIEKEFLKLQNYLLSNLEMKNNAFQIQIQNEMDSLLKDWKEDKEEKEKLIQNGFINLQKNDQNNIAHLEEGLSHYDDLVKVRLDQIDKTIDSKLSEFKNVNEERLEAIQEVVNEKLEKTLNERLKQSFDSLVTEISHVYQAVGEIKNMTKEVDSLRNVLTNVKVRGIVGEVVLGNLISEVLTHDQYEENVITKKGSNERVEYAIKMPGKDEKPVYMPVDSKFPLEDYRMMKEAIEEGNKDKLQEARKNLKAKIKVFSKDIHDKYIDSGNTTDFGILFLPIESLYAEVSDMGLVEEMQREYKIVIVSPSTFLALLNALQMGFKSVSIEKKSVEITELLYNVKKQFDSFADALVKTQTSINKASTDLENLVGTRTRQLKKQLDKIETSGYIEKEE